MPSIVEAIKTATGAKGNTIADVLNDLSGGRGSNIADSAKKFVSEQREMHPDHDELVCWLIEGYFAGNDNPYIKAVIDDKVLLPGTNKIKDYLFYGDVNITTIKIPTWLKVIGNFSFASCTGLTSLTFDGITDGTAEIEQIAGHSFEGCTALAGEVKFPASLHSVGSSAFEGDSNITTAFFANDDLTAAHYLTINSKAFKGCTKLSALKLSANMGSIHDQAFSGCSALTAVVIPGGGGESKVIGYNAFENCGALRLITLPSDITAIRDDAFKNIASDAVINCGFVSGAVTGAPWGAPVGVTINYATELIPA